MDGNGRLQWEQGGKGREDLSDGNHHMCNTREAKKLDRYTPCSRKVRIVKFAYLDSALSECLAHGRVSWKSEHLTPEAPGTTN